MSLALAFQACVRFGLGPRGDELRQIGGDPRGWLERQLQNAAIPPEVLLDAGGRQALKNLIAAKGDKEKIKDEQLRAALKDVYIAETAARFSAQIASTQPFVERLVLFWSNHFTVSVQKPIVAALANRYEVEAIRPHVTGYFHNMLLAVVQHPAMLVYLDNVQSIGPDSIAGQRRGKGLNENLARELMELHTLGVDGGYTQADVIALANILTGWSFDRQGGEVRIMYQFIPRFHQPGEKILLGRRYAESGEQEGLAALKMLVAHPATAKHLARKLAQHFIGDRASPAAVATLEQAYRASDGYLPAVYDALIRLDEPWTNPLAKVKSPYDYLISACRLLEFTPPPQMTLKMLDTLDFRPFNANSPAGYPDGDTVWAAPDEIMKRIDWAHAFAQRYPSKTDPLALAARAIGPVIRPETAQTIQHAASGKDGLAFLLISPEFLRR